MRNARIAGGRLFADVTGKKRQDERIVLKEIARQESSATAPKGGGAPIVAGAPPACLRVATRACDGSGIRRPPERSEAGYSDLLGDHRGVVGGHRAAGIAQEQRRPARELAGEDSRAHVGAHLREPGVDRVGRDLASRHIDDLVPRALFQKTNGRFAARCSGSSFRRFGLKSVEGRGRRGRAHSSV